MNIQNVQGKLYIKKGKTIIFLVIREDEYLRKFIP